MAKQEQIKATKVVKATKSTKAAKAKDKEINNDSPSGKVKYKN